jgi:hypothetical protein
MDGPNPNPNVANTSGGQIKSNQMEPPRKKKEQINSNPGPETPNGAKCGGARKAPPFGGFNRFARHFEKPTRGTNRSIVGPTHDPGAIRSNVLLARLMRRMPVREFGS